jgi:hypothetical protein
MPVISSRRRSPRRRSLGRAVLDAQLIQQPLQARALLGPGQRHGLQDRQDVLFDRELPEHGRLLRQVADAGPGSLVHRCPGQLVVVQKHTPRVRSDQPDYHVEGSGLARAVRSQQPHDLSLRHLQIHVRHHPALPVDLHQPPGRSCRPAARPPAQPAGRVRR